MKYSKDDLRIVAKTVQEYGRKWFGQGCKHIDMMVTPDYMLVITAKLASGGIAKKSINMDEVIRLAKS